MTHPQGFLDDLPRRLDTIFAVYLGGPRLQNRFWHEGFSSIHGVPQGRDAVQVVTSSQGAARSFLFCPMADNTEKTAIASRVTGA